MFDASVIIPTILRNSLLKSASSVFKQKVNGQLLIGVDKNNSPIIDQIKKSAPSNWSVYILDPGYSTSVFHKAATGGALRTILSYLANSRYVAYLDDDNWWDEDHLSSLLNAIQGNDCAFSRRWFVDKEKLCVDDWESVGPGKGVYNANFGGFVDPSSLMIDKVICEQVLWRWAVPLRGDITGMSADRNVFHGLLKYKWAETGKATCYYQINPNDPVNAERMKYINQSQST